MTAGIDTHRFLTRPPCHNVTVLSVCNGALGDGDLPSIAAEGCVRSVERSLSTAADHCVQSFEGTTLGVYRVYRTQPVEGGCLFFIEGGLLNSIGLAHFPDGAPYIGEPQHEGDIGYEEFDGDWYQFEQLF